MSTRPTIASLKAELEAERKAFADFKERATRIAHEYAEEYNLCEEFDNVMKEIGLPPRTHTYRVSVVVTLEIDVEAENSIDAEESIEDSKVVEELNKELERVQRTKDNPSFAKRMLDWETDGAENID